MTDKLPAAKFPPFGYMPHERAEHPQHEHKPDMVNGPPHYRQGKIECITAIEASICGVKTTRAVLRVLRKPNGI